jgi:hypothetical protein
MAAPIGFPDGVAVVRAYLHEQWSKPKEENPDEAINKRILLAAGILRKDYGFKVVVDGRGTTGTIKATPPGKTTRQKKGR